MGSYGFDIDRLDATPREVILKGLGKRPPLPREPIILDPKGNDTTKDTKSTDEKLTK